MKTRCNRIGIFTGCFFIFAVVLLMADSPAAASETVSLKVYEGYNFQRKAIIKSDDPACDLSFYVNRGRSGAASFALGALGAKRIKEFGAKKPAAADLAAQSMKDWKTYANAPSEGYYVIRAAQGESVYLIKVLDFKNQGKAASYWELRFTWEKL